MFIRLESSDGNSEMLLNMDRVDRVVETDGWTTFVRDGQQPIKAKIPLDQIEALLIAARWLGKTDYGLGKTQAGQAFDVPGTTAAKKVW